MPAPQPIDHYVTLHGIRYHYAEWPGTGSTILCLHGITSNCRSFDVLAGKLAPAHRVIAVDLRGRGESGEPGAVYGFEQHISDLVALLDELQLKQVAVIGHSMGGLVGILLSARHPERVSRLVVIDAGARSRPEVLDMIRPALARLGQTFPSREVFLAGMRAVPVWGDDWSDAVEKYYDADLRTNADGTVQSRVVATAVQQDIAGMAKLDFTAMLPDIQCPTLILRATLGLLGGESGLILLPEDAKAMASGIPNCRSVDIAGVNHYAIVYRQAEPLRDRELLEFLSD
jgi:pimeloyl-ACP methyl ester carboxylesterase